MPSFDVFAYEYFNEDKGSQTVTKISDYSFRVFSGQVSIISPNKFFTVNVSPLVNFNMFGGSFLNYSYGFNSSVYIKTPSKYISPEIYGSVTNLSYMNNSYSVYNGMKYSTGAGLSFNIFNQGKQIARIVPYSMYEVNSLQANYTSFEAYSIGLKILFNLPYKIITVINGSYRNRGFSYIDPFFGSYRNGHNYNASVVVKKEIYKSLYGYISYDYIGQDSDIALYRFQKHQFSTGVEFKL
jgi:hypothetical protein